MFDHLLRLLGRAALHFLHTTVDTLALLRAVRWCEVLPGCIALRPLCKESAVSDHARVVRALGTWVRQYPRRNVPISACTAPTVFHECSGPRIDE